MKTGFIILGVAVALLLFCIYDRYRRRRDIKKRLIADYGTAKVSSMTQKRYELLSAYRDSLFGRTYDIDEITWNDLEMDRVYKALNRTCSAVGEEYMYAALFRPEFCEDELNRREELIRLVSDNEDARLKLQISLSEMGKIRNLSLYSYLTSFDGVREDSNLFHCIPILGFVASIVCGMLDLFLPCVWILVLTAGFSIVTYYRRKSAIEPYLRALMYVSSWVGGIGRMRRDIHVPDTVLDRELEGLLARQGMHIHYADDIMVYDEKVSSSENFQRQRLRWMSGQVQTLMLMLPYLPKAIFHGNVNYVDKTIQQALVPRSLLLLFTFPIAILLTVSFVFWGNCSGGNVQCSMFRWWGLFIAQCLAIFLAIPSSLRLRALRHALQFPRMAWLMAKNLLHLNLKSKEFLHTTHNTGKDVEKLKTV